MANSIDLPDQYKVGDGIEVSMYKPDQLMLIVTLDGITAGAIHLSPKNVDKLRALLNNQPQTKSVVQAQDDNQEVYRMPELPSEALLDLAEEIGVGISWVQTSPPYYFTGELKNGLNFEFINSRGVFQCFEDREDEVIGGGPTIKDAYRSYINALISMAQVETLRLANEIGAIISKFQFYETGTTTPCFKAYLDNDLQIHLVLKNREFRCYNNCNSFGVGATPKEAYEDLTKHE